MGVQEKLFWVGDWLTSIRLSRLWSVFLSGWLVDSSTIEALLDDFCDSSSDWPPPTWNTSSSRFDFELRFETNFLFSKITVSPRRNWFSWQEAWIAAIVCRPGDELAWFECVRIRSFS